MSSKTNRTEKAAVGFHSGFFLRLFYPYEKPPRVKARRGFIGMDKLI